MEPLYLIDGYALIFRAYFAFMRTPMKDTQGRNRSAVFGFFRMILSFLKQYHPKLLAIVLDPGGPTFRDELYPDYKGTRQETPEDLKEQFPIIDKVLAALKIPVLRVECFEADDVIATMALRCREEGRPCFVLSGDKDLMQLVDDLVHMLRPSRDGGFDDMDAQAVFTDKGVRPDQIVDYLSLVGDSSDNVPGVAGIGDKSAAKLLASYGSLDAIYEKLENIDSASQRQKLANGKESALFSKRLVTLRTDAPVPEGTTPLGMGCTILDGPAAAAALREENMQQLAADWEKLHPGTGASVTAEHVPSLSANNDDDAGPLFSTPENEKKETIDDQPKSGPENTTSAGPKFARYNPQLQNYELIRDADRLAALCAELSGTAELAVDTETEGLNPLSDALNGVSLCAAENQAYYVAIRGPEGDVIGLETARKYLGPLLSQPKTRFIGQNAKFDDRVLYQAGMPVRAWAFDTMLAAWCLDSDHAAYNMDDLARNQLSYEPISFDSLFPEGTKAAAKKDASLYKFSKITLEKAAVYSAEDADVTLKLAHALEPQLKALKVDRVFYEVEMPLVPILARMEDRGIPLDSMELERFAQELEVRLAALEQEIHRMVGYSFNINSTKQLQDVLFVTRGLKPVKKTQTGYSTDTGVLEELARQDPVAHKLLEYRSLNKLKSTYADTLPALINPKTGRIHTSFIQNGTATGRMSSRDPNMQNIPIRDEMGRRIRSAFIAPEGSVFVSADYSQIELVVMAHLANDPGLRSAFEQGVDVHRLTASLLFGTPVPEVSSEQRRIAKTINFGVLYGMSAFRLSNELDIPQKQAQAFIEGYFASYPAIKSFVAETVKRAEADGGVRTMLGRFRPIPAINSRNRNEKNSAERIAVNTPIQGTAADIVKLAMVRVDTRLKAENLSSRLVLQVHDELILEVPESERERVMGLCREEMSAALLLSVPLAVSVESGKRWGDVH